MNRIEETPKENNLQFYQKNLLTLLLDADGNMTTSTIIGKNTVATDNKGRYL
ncbi:hypothetical protein [Pectinatus cerevisiiphilus]|uniref:hypothetical protein n=1 Tax=Pectinatus cerevisiiphilus TaxID=86956 RepID=UPI001404C242|nr:hypothetical protein [Pectinatus cerevisiiphilus]